MSPRRKDNTSNDKLTFGKYILESLSVGMYSHPLMSLREYVQNSADSIDCLPDAQHGTLIEIAVDGRKRSVTIHDNGAGISSSKAKSTLLNIGCSEKTPTLNRGFRGVGRLGGLSYCDELRFVTKSRGEDAISICTWDCKKLRQFIADLSISVDTETLIKAVSMFKQQKYPGSLDDHFFKVEMNMIHGGRNELLNVPAIRSYLSQVAPVPFNPNFGFGQLIDKELVTHVKSYRTYDIFVNGQRIYKPYGDVVSLSKGSSESVKKIDFVELQGESGMLGFGWIADLSLQGIVSASTDMDGLRLRCGNILIGNKDTLSGFFRERRFNNYLVGEIHVCVNELIPNSRRDDFEDNAAKDELINAFIREIGIPFSRKIRYLSNERAKEKSSTNLDTLFENATKVIRFGYISELQREYLIKNLQTVNGNSSGRAKELTSELIENVQNSKHILSVLGSQHHRNGEVVNLFSKALEIIYAETFNRPEAEKIISKLYRMIFEELDNDF
ncbi:MAG: ATP-binding protein [Candidatus Thorarchaeota archaeon]